jgi:ubiquinone/menaquinone biosynthesis C-methylase UbiE
LNLPTAPLEHGLAYNIDVKEDDMTRTEGRTLAPHTTGLIVHWAARYDFLVWLITLGRERAFRENLVRLARLQLGETVLDVGCGTGTLAISAKQRVGSTGTVCGIDASPEMIARAKKKARKAGVEIDFRNSIAEALPFPEAHFDVVLSTVMLHHLPDEARQQCACEIRRVLKREGRLLAVDFGGAPQGRRSIIAHFHRHATFDLREVLPVFRNAGLATIESGAVGISDLRFVLASARMTADPTLERP